MENNLIIFSSVTHAMKSRDLLKRNKIFSKIVRTPVNIKKAKSSCGYSLYVPNNFDKALNIIGSSGISVLGVYAVKLL